MTENTDNTDIAPKLPAGRPPGSRSIRVLAARLSQDAMRVLAGVASREDAPAADRVRAAEVILEYATRRPEESK